MKHGCLFKKENMVIFQKNVMSLLSTSNWFLIMKYHASYVYWTVHHLDS